LISGSLTRSSHPSRVVIRLGTPEGMVDTIIGHLPDMTAVDAALRHTLGW